MNPTSPTQSVYEGKLGRTTRASVLVTSQTGTAFPASIYTSINVTQNPDLGDALLDGTLNQIDCPFTDATYDIAVPVLYHDEEARLFVLVMPASLRHRALEERSRVLAELSEDSENVPAYVSNFQTVFDPAAIDDLDEAAQSTTPPAATTAPDELETSKELARERQKLEEEREALEIEKNQLDEVRSRFDREREQMDEVETRLQTQREELEALREELTRREKELEADRLNREGEQIRAESGEESASEESTQVVTDDQFIEVVDEDDADEDLLAQASEPVVDEEESADDAAASAEEAAAEERPEETVITPRADGIPTKFRNVVSGERDRAVKIVDDHVLAVSRLPQERIESILDTDVSFFVQYHDVAGYPLVALVLAHLDDNDQSVESVAWSLDVGDDGHRLLLDHLADRFHLRVGLYGEDDNLKRAVDVTAPLEENVEWIRAEAEETLTAARSKGAEFESAEEEFHSEEFERLGSMRHNFTRESFEEATTPSEVKLAAGIVGYWSTPDQYRYLVANRSFPVRHFREVQERVARRAVDAGIYLNEPLRDVAVELGLSTDAPAVIDRLMANFAEVCVSIRKNDLDPIEQWENWDALLTAGEELGVPPDPDVVELADVSLKRAQEYQELHEMSDVEEIPEEDESDESVESDDVGEASAEGEGEAESEDEGEDEQEAEKTVVEVDSTLIVSKRSETTGVTYFLPDDAVLDTFDDLASMSREDLELLLADAKGRLEAAQMLLERFGSDATDRVLEATETMNAPEVAALAKFLETKADGLEGDLVRAVENGGPSATYVASQALAKIRSTSAIPVLVEAFQDPDRQGNKERLAEALSQYGEKLLPALTRAIKRNGADDNLVLLLSKLEEHTDGVLADLSKDRSKKLREAARMARKRIEARSA